MYDYLGFPRDNIVKKNMTIDKYLNTASLTNAEKRNLSAYLKTIKLLYSFPFADDEIIVVLSEFSIEEIKRYIIANFVTAIAQSIPYKMLLIVKCEGVLRLFIFDERLNKRDNTRSKVSDIYVSKYIITTDNDYFDRKFIGEMSSAIEVSITAEDLYYRWIEIIKKQKNPESLIDIDFRYEVAEYMEKIENNRKKRYYDENFILEDPEKYLKHEDFWQVEEIGDEYDDFS